MISDAEIDVEVEQILARIATFRRRVEEIPGYAEATAVGFLGVGLEAAENEIRGGYQCMTSGLHAPPAPIDYEVEYGMTALWRN